MHWLNRFLCYQGQLLLNNRWQALLHAVLLALLPYTTWLSVTIIALVTLRKGEREGGIILAGAMTAHVLLSIFYLSPTASVINTLFIFTPCFLAAILLRSTANWHAVASFFFIAALIGVILLQTTMPDFIMIQYQYVLAALKGMQNENALLVFLKDKNALHVQAFANYMFGIQLVGIIFSATLSLMLARFIQSALYYPGGFKEEMLSFRGDKRVFLLLAIVWILAKQGNVLAMNIVPIILFYFLLAGISLGFMILAQKKPFNAFLIVITSLLLLPFMMFPMYIISGLLDSLFNFRQYLPVDADNTHISP